MDANIRYGIYTEAPQGSCVISRSYLITGDLPIQTSLDKTTNHHLHVGLHLQSLLIIPTISVIDPRLPLSPFTQSPSRSLSPFSHPLGPPKQQSRVAAQAEPSH